MSLVRLRKSVIQHIRTFLDFWLLLEARQRSRTENARLERRITSLLQIHLLLQKLYIMTGWRHGRHIFDR